jgi:LuxR family maltose regulon positive regulatory protein
MLRWIAQHNLFLSALDDSGFWFRYHPLMRDALLHRLQPRRGYSPAARSRQRLVRRAAAVGRGDTPCAGRRKIGGRDAEAGAQSLAEEGDIDTLVRGYATCQPISTRRASSFSLTWPGR